MEAEIGEHPGILRAFTREQESQAAGPLVQERLVPVINAPAVANRPASRVGQAGQHGGESLGQLGKRRRDQAQTRAARRMVADGC